MKNNILNCILTWIWCFPQMLCGLIVAVFTKAKRVGDHYEYNVRSGSLSLGTYIFLSPFGKMNKLTLMHEKGHTKQSYILGWLYLIVIGIPSAIWCGCFKNYRYKNGISYFSFYTEKWADKLAGITRDHKG